MLRGHHRAYYALPLLLLLAAVTAAATVPMSSGRHPLQGRAARLFQGNFVLERRTRKARFSCKIVSLFNVHSVAYSLQAFSSSLYSKTRVDRQGLTTHSVCANAGRDSDESLINM